MEIVYGIWHRLSVGMCTTNGNCFVVIVMGNVYLMEMVWDIWCRLMCMCVNDGMCLLRLFCFVVICMGVCICWGTERSEMSMGICSWMCVCIDMGERMVESYNGRGCSDLCWLYEDGIGVPERVKWGVDVIFSGLCMYWQGWRLVLVMHVGVGGECMKAHNMSKRLTECLRRVCTMYWRG